LLKASRCTAQTSAAQASLHRPKCRECSRMARSITLNR
jgi:hypothetical protein